MNARSLCKRTIPRQILRRSSRASRLARLFAVATLVASVGAPGARAVMLGQLDSFQDGTALAWVEGAPSPNPPVNIATGGPAGAGDRYLQDISTAGFGAGSRLLMYNEAQWQGNYAAAGVTQLVAEMANFGSTTLFMRVTLSGGPAGATQFSSTSVLGTTLPPDGMWRTLTFDLSPSALTRVGGTGTLPVLLSSVTELRVLSAAGGPTLRGDVIAATLGMDNLRAVPEPSVAAALILGVLGLGLRQSARRRQSAALHGERRFVGANYRA